jgi:hypothetical protein
VVGVMESQCDGYVTGRNSRERRERVKTVTWSPGTFLFGTVLLTSQIRPPHYLCTSLYLSHVDFMNKIILCIYYLQ